MLLVFLLRNYNVIGAGPLDPNGWLIGPKPSGPMSHKSQLYKNVYITHTDQDNYSKSLLKYVAIIPLNPLPIWGVLLQGLREYSLKSKKNDSSLPSLPYLKLLVSVLHHLTSWLFPL